MDLHLHRITESVIRVYWLSFLETGQVSGNHMGCFRLVCIIGIPRNYIFLVRCIEYSWDGKLGAIQISVTETR